MPRPKKPPSLEGWITVEEAAKLKGVLPGTVRRRIHRGKLPAVKHSDVYFIREADLAAWVVREAAKRDAS